MTGNTIPIILTVVAILVAIAAYRGVRRGATRFYTLERETMLRRASFTMMASVLLFLAAIILLVYNQQQANVGESTVTAEAGEAEQIEVLATTDPVLQSLPPTPTATPTLNPNIPTVTPTPIICRAIVEGTAGSGLTLRDAPAGAEVSILPDGSILTLLEDEPEEVNNFIWRKVRTVARDEGWVVEQFLKMGECR